MRKNKKGLHMTTAGGIKVSLSAEAFEDRRFAIPYEADGADFLNAFLFLVLWTAREPDGKAKVDDICHREYRRAFPEGEDLLFPTMTYMVCLNILDMDEEGRIGVNHEEFPWVTCK